MMRLWNHQVHLWLKFYVLERITPRGKRPGARESIFVFLVSAFWHGFYPFYYVMFFFAALTVEAAKDVFKARFLFKQVIPSFLVAPLGWFFSMTCLNYCGILQNALTFENGFAFMKNTYYFQPLGLILFVFLSRNMGLVGIAKKMEKKAEEKQK